MFKAGIVHPIDEHPIPFDPEEIEDVWREADGRDPEDAPHVDAAHEEYVDTIAEHGAWHVFRTCWPFANAGVVFWNREFGEGFLAPDDGEWHELVNLFAAIVEDQGDCRDADLSSSLMPSGAQRYSCSKCGANW